MNFTIPQNNFRDLLLKLLLFGILSFFVSSLLAQTDVAIENEYLEAIKKGDQYISEEKYDRALYYFESASRLKPTEKYPKEKIRLINEQLDEEKTKNILFEVSITSAERWFKASEFKKAKIEYENALKINPTAQYPKDRLAQISKLWSDPEVDAAYAKAILKADDFFSKESYQGAKAEYMTASDLKPHEQYPLDRILEINDILASRHALQQAYEEFIRRADDHFDQNEYENARDNYSDASGLKPDEIYPKNRIREIEKILADLVTQRDKYNKIIALADDYYINNDLEKAKIEYRKAASTMPGERYPGNMISKLDPLIDEQLGIQRSYDLAISNAEKHLQAEDYESAITSLLTASEIKPEESYPKEKIAEINGIIAEIEAEEQRQQELLLAEQQRQEQLALEEQQRQEQLALEEQQRQKQLRIERENQKGYSDAIEEADRLFVERSYETAKSKYQLALGIRPEENYPRTRIRKLEELLAQKASAQRDYNNAITQGDTYFSEEKYQQATSSFKEALTIFPDEPYPKNKIDEIDSIIEALNIQKEYDDAIVKADLFFKQGNYKDAVKNYQDAFNIKPDEKYPINKIDEINVAIQANEVDREKAYNDAIALADKYYSEEDYKNAKNQYQAAIRINPDESYPRERLKKVEKMLLAREMELAEVYQKAIAKADDLYNKKILDQAIQAYRDAKKIKPDETYPDNRINSIRIFIEEHAIVELVTSSVIIKSNSDEKYSFPPINIRFRKNNYILLKARIIGEDNAKVYLSYGQNGQKYGGIVLKSIQRGEINDYIIRISAQDPWYRNDNNWLSIYSEGGNIEVTSLQISQGD